MDLKPIFVSGVGRSGTSAVLASLAEHASVNTDYRIGEAPFVASFLNFLTEFEGTSPSSSYNLLNYRLDDDLRRKVIANFITLNQCGVDFNDIDMSESQYWITKVSLTEASYEKAIEIYGEVRCVYIKRNGIEVINSAMRHPGFAKLSFAEHCDRWKENLKSCKYLLNKPLCSIVKHDKLVKEPESCFQVIQQDLRLPQDEAPANWIRTNIFNSSFDNSSSDEKAKNIFDKRLLKAWESWDFVSREEFKTRCDATMSEHGFTRPYISDEPFRATRIRPERSEIEEVVSNEKCETSVKRVYTDKIYQITKNRINVDVFNYVCNASDKYKYLFVNNPKVASTSLLKELQRLEDADMALKMSNTHTRAESPLLSLSLMKKRQQEKYLYSSKVLRFAFVRCPYERLLSAYLSKINKPLLDYKYDANRPNYLPPKAQVISIITQKAIDESTDFSMKIDFETFVDVVCEQSVSDMDSHWKPQRDVILPDEITYDSIGRFENFDIDFTRIMKNLSIDQAVLPEYSSNRTDSRKQLEKYYDAGIKKKVHEKYESDFHEFGYADTVKKIYATS